MSWSGYPRWAIEFDLRPNSGLLLRVAAGQCAPNGFVCIQVHHAQITRKKSEVYPPAAASKLNPILILQFEAWMLGKSCVYLVESLSTNVCRRGMNLPRATILGENFLASCLMNMYWESVNDSTESMSTYVPCSGDHSFTMNKKEMCST